MTDGLFTFRSVWSRTNEKWEIIAWVGPEKSLRPESRTSFTHNDKYSVYLRQKKKCNQCESPIVLYPYSSADADHIIPISIGGKTTIENLQLLCVICHRHKTVVENRCVSKNFYIMEYKQGTYILPQSSDLRISFKDETEYMTPYELIESNHNPDSIRKLCYYKSSSVSKVSDFKEFLDKFKYIPP